MNLSQPTKQTRPEVEARMQNSRSYKAYQLSPYRSIKYSTYFNTYDELFSRFIDTEITFVEIGVLDGGSLFMWREFFGPKARIIGVDLSPDAERWREHGFEIYIGSQQDPKFWADLKRKIGQIDILLDDGGHTYEQQIVTVECAMSAVKNGGLIVVEDCHTSYMTKFGIRRTSFINYAKNMVDGVNYRFTRFNHKPKEKAVWNISFFESIVAFHIDREKCALKSEHTDNKGESMQAVDMRFVGLSYLPNPDRHTGILKFVAKHVRRILLLATHLCGSIRLRKFFKY